MSNTKFFGIIGDVNPIEHSGGVVFQDLTNAEGEEAAPEVLYFDSWTNAEGEDRVTLYRFCVDFNLLDESWVDVEAICNYCDLDEAAFRKASNSENPLARACVYEAVASYNGYSLFDDTPQEMTLEEAEEKYGDFVDACHASA